MFDRASQGAPRADDMLLPDVLRERARAHACRERLRRFVLEESHLRAGPRVHGKCFFGFFVAAGRGTAAGVSAGVVIVTLPLPSSSPVSVS